MMALLVFCRSDSQSWGWPAVNSSNVHLPNSCRFSMSLALTLTNCGHILAWSDAAGILQWPEGSRNVATTDKITAAFIFPKAEILSRSFVSGKKQKHWFVITEVSLCATLRSPRLETQKNLNRKRFVCLSSGWGSGICRSSIPEWNRTPRIDYESVPIKLMGFVLYQNLKTSLCLNIVKSILCHLVEWKVQKHLVFMIGKCLKFWVKLTARSDCPNKNCTARIPASNFAQKWS